jgi:hypothetical protein
LSGSAWECGIRSAEFGMRSAEFGMRSAECGVRNAECGMPNSPPIGELSPIWPRRELCARGDGSQVAIRSFRVSGFGFKGPRSKDQGRILRSRSEWAGSWWRMFRVKTLVLGRTFLSPEQQRGAGARFRIFVFVSGSRSSTGGFRNNNLRQPEDRAPGNSVQGAGGQQWVFGATETKNAGG